MPAEAAYPPPDTGGHDETTPLLAERPTTAEEHLVASDAEHSAENRREDDDRPLPVGQILLLCAARITEPIAYFSIFPFVNQMIRSMGIAEENVGFYGGMIESLFSVTQMMVMVAWGRAADRFGRKPVLVLSLAGVTACTALFGFASTIWQMILFRSLAGIFAGTIVTVRTMTNEHSTPKTQARAFSWFAVSGNIGILIGPLIGGALADPAGQYGGVFARIQFFNDFPYALPTLATGLTSFCGLLLAIFFIQETMPKKSDLDPSKPTSMMELIRSPGVGKVIFLYGFVMLLAFSYTAVVPVCLFTSVRLGGFSFTELQISFFMALTGGAQAIWLLLVFPPLQQRIGTGGVLRACGLPYPLLFVIYPALNLLLRQDTDTARLIFWIISPPLLCFGVGVSMSFTASQLALNDISPSPQTLGTLNSLALVCISAVRAASPAIFTSIFAEGVRHQILRGWLVWAVMAAMAALYGFSLRWLPSKAEGRLERRS